jgi:hypothetical protein
MQVTVYDLVVTQFVSELNALKGILKKANAFADSKKIKFDVILNLRLIPDQFAFVRQVQIVTDTAKGACSRLAGDKAPVFEDTETTYEQLQQRIDNTIAYCSGFKPEQFNGFDKTRVEFFWNPGKHLEGRDYLVQHAIPNFYFHLTTAYSILRANGVELGKGDYMGQQNWKNS